MMKKSLLALAIAGLSANAFAFNLDKVGAAAASTTLPYAAEIKISDTTNGDILALPNVNVTKVGSPAGDIRAVRSEVGFSIEIGNKRYVRYDLTGADFDTAAITAAKLSISNGLGDSPAKNPQISVVVSKVAKDHVIFEITATDVDAGGGTTERAVNQADILNFEPALKVKAKGDIALKYRLYETATSAIAGGADALSSTNGNSLAKFTSALKFSTNLTTAARKIDVAQESKYFDNGSIKKELESTLGIVSTAVDTDAYLLNGSKATALNNILSSYNLVVGGNFASASKVKVGATAEVTGTDLTASSATYKNAAAAAQNDAIVFVTNGTAVISESAFNVKLVPTAATGYEVSEQTLNLNDLKKNGSSELLNLALKPGGAYSNFVRISNTSGIEGKFFVTVIADDGKSVTLNLNDIQGQPATLAARASTNQMTIQNIFDAAAAKGLALAGEGKLRLMVEGEVPSLDAQIYTVSKDGNSFATF